jgi:hypothetical protein
MKLGTPSRGLAFITRILTEDRYAGSSIILTDKSRDQIASQQFQVMAVGEFEICEEEDCERFHNWAWGRVAGVPPLHPHDVKIGDWILAKNRSWLETPNPDIYCIRVEDILGKFLET